MMDYQQYGVGSQLAPQGFFGSLIGAPLGGLIGRGIGGLFGHSNLGNQIGQAAGGVGGAILPFGADPVSAAYAQQAQQQAQQQQLQQMQLQQLQQQMQQEQLAQQLAPQGWFGNLVSRVAQPLGGAIGGMFGNAGLGNTIGGVASKIGGMLPFANDPVTAAYAQQAQQQQQLQQLQQIQQIQQAQQAQQAQLAQQLAQQGQLAPQGWFGNLLGQVGQPLGSAIGGIFGNAGLGGTIGGIAGKIGSVLPFGADPVAAAYAQQAQLAQQQAQLAQLAQQQQQAQIGQQLANGTYNAYQSPGIVPPNVYAATGQQTLH